MSNYETITLLVSIVAIVISAVSLIRTNKVASHQLELEKVHAELSKKHLDKINNEDKINALANIDVDLVKVDENYRFIIKNIGGSTASNVFFSLSACQRNPLVQNDVKDKLPIKSLRPNKSVSLMATKVMNCDSEYTVNVRWTNPDGTNSKDSIILTW